MKVSRAAPELGAWVVGGLLAAAAHAAFALSLAQRELPKPFAPPEGGYVVELAEIETSRGTELEDLALGQEARAQEEIPPTVMKEPPAELAPPLPEQSEVALPEVARPPTMAPPRMAPAMPQQAVEHDSTTHMATALLDDIDRARVQSVAQKPADPQAVAEWMRALQIALQKSKVYPEDARKAKTQGTATARLTLAAAGDFVDAVIVEGSGSASLDEAALKLLATAGPYPPPPSTGANGQVRILVPINYSLK
ncbi:energy transducer TonB [Phaeovulum sp.]|uniref:energy transducer TonB n=1 Tax=Phaeovulum sp. TaxID=2934796 RepID=UPI00356A8CC2